MDSSRRPTSSIVKHFEFFFFVLSTRFKQKIQLPGKCQCTWDPSKKRLEERMLN